MRDAELSDLQIAAAIGWWGARVREGKFDNGARDFANVLAGAMASKLHQSQQISALAVGTFVHTLAETLKRGGVELHGRLYDHRGILSTDYAPDAFLQHALVAAGLDPETTLPWKTIMWFMDGGVKVRPGYGAAERWVMQPTHVRVSRRGPNGATVLKPATRYWKRRALRFYVHDRHAGLLERLLTHQLRCRACGLPAYAWQHRDPTSFASRAGGGHAFADPLPSVKWRAVRTSLRAIRDGKEDETMLRAVRS